MLTAFAIRVALAKAYGVRWQNALGRALAASVVLHGAVLVGLRRSETLLVASTPQAEAEPVWVD